MTYWETSLKSLSLFIQTTFSFTLLIYYRTRNMYDMVHKYFMKISFTLKPRNVSSTFAQYIFWGTYSRRASIIPIHKRFRPLETDHSGWQKTTPKTFGLCKFLEASSKTAVKLLPHLPHSRPVGFSSYGPPKPSKHSLISRRGFVLHPSSVTLIQENKSSSKWNGCIWLWGWGCSISNKSYRQWWAPDR